MPTINPVPVQVRILQAFSLDGRDYQVGEVTELQWIWYKRKSKIGAVERVFDMPRNTTPVRDVLVFTPVYRLEPETVHALMLLEFGGALSLLLQRDNPDTSGDRRAGIDNHLHQYRRGREAFLQGRWDAMLVIESDIVPPADTIGKLAALQVDVAYGVYRFRVSDVINVSERYPPPARNPGESLSVKPWLFVEAVKKGKYPCSGLGLGCVLIRRKVLEQIDFHIEPNSGHCDTPFNNDVYQAGFSQMADMTVICGHKEENGEVLWPSMPLLS